MAPRRTESASSVGPDALADYQAPPSSPVQGQARQRVGAITAVAL